MELRESRRLPSDTGLLGVASVPATANFAAVLDEPWDSRIGDVLELHALVVMKLQHVERHLRNAFEMPLTG